MRYIFVGLCIAALVGCGGGGSKSRNTDTVSRGAGSGLIERACNASERRASNPTLCSCVQQTADLTLSRSDQQLAVTFFTDPHRAQEIRQSDNLRHEAFWKRYKEFSATAKDYCSPVSS